MNIPRIQRVSWVVTALALILLVGIGMVLNLHLQVGRKISGQGVDRAAATREHFQRQASVDAQLVRWRQVEEIACEAEGLSGVALDSAGKLYVSGDAGVAVIERGKPNAMLATPGGPARCVAVFEGEGAPRVLVGVGGRVVVMDGAQPAQTLLTPAGAGYVTGIAPTRDTVWVADAGNRRVIGFGWDGTEKARIGAPDKASNDPGFVVPSPFMDIAPTPEGGFVVANPGKHRIQTHDATGKRVNSWGKAASSIEGFCGCCNPTHLCLLPDGRVVTAEKGIARVKAYATDGTLESVVAPPEALSRRVEGMDLATDGEGRVYVLDPGARAVRVFEETGGPDSRP